MNSSSSVAGESDIETGPRQEFIDSCAEPAGLFRRLAAAWIDFFILYVTASLVIAIAALVGLRLALEPVGLTLGAVYGVIALWGWGRTVGKRLLNVEVMARDGGRPGLPAILIREALAKWGLMGAAPGIIARLVYGPAWVPTAYDLLAVLLFALPSLAYYGLFRTAWYDHLAGTRVIRTTVDNPKLRSAFMVVGALAILGAATKGLEWAVLGYVPSRVLLYHGMGSTRSYVDFLKKPHATAKDYILDLFDRYDVVVLCERAHPEATQWDFIYDLVSDPRFRERIGHVFTEMGQTGMQSYLDEFMATDGLSDQEVKERVLHILRHWAVWPRWNRVNFPTYLTRLYALNQSLPPKLRIRHHFTDVPVDWPALTTNNMPEHWRSLMNRDEKMARVILDEMRSLEQAKGQPAKCLVVMNFRHAFDLTARYSGAPRFNTCEFLREALESRVANVRINEGIFWPTAGGLWDVAFEQQGNQPTGFDLAGSPFGREPFDLFPWEPDIRGHLMYQDVFTGYVFVHPQRMQFFLEGIPGYYTGWEEEVRRRAALVGSDFVKTVEEEIAREKRGDVPVKSPHIVFQIESIVGIVVAGYFGLGFVVGLIAFLLRHRARAPLAVPQKEHMALV